jgi:hypothetical protein
MGVSPCLTDRMGLAGRPLVPNLACSPSLRLSCVRQGRKRVSAWGSGHVVSARLGRTTTFFSPELQSCTQTARAHAQSSTYGHVRIISCVKVRGDTDPATRVCRPVGAWAWPGPGRINYAPAACMHAPTEPIHRAEASGHSALTAMYRCTYVWDCLWSLESLRSSACRWRLRAYSPVACYVVRARVPVTHGT